MVHLVGSCYTDTLIILNTCCFPAATMATRVIVTLYVYCQSCSIFKRSTHMLKLWNTNDHVPAACITVVSLSVTSHSLSRSTNRSLVLGRNVATICCYAFQAVCADNLPSTLNSSPKPSHSNFVIPSIITPTYVGKIFVFYDRKRTASVV